MNQNLNQTPAQSLSPEHVEAFAKIHEFMSNTPYSFLMEQAAKAENQLLALVTHPGEQTEFGELCDFLFFSIQAFQILQPLSQQKS